MILKLDEVDSTNEYLKRFVADGYSGEDIIVVSAEYQTQGKGRRGRQWVTEPGTALTFSVLLKPKMDLSDCSMLTLVMAMAVRRALADIDVETSIKWPNDIVIGGKKVCGILTEAIAETGHIIIGCGVNTNQESYPEDLADRSTSVLIETNDCVDHDSLLESIIYHLEKLIDIFLETKDFTNLKDEYEEALVSLNSEVTVLDPDGEYKGNCLGIDNKGQLRVEHDGKEECVYAGEVSVRGVYGYV